ncbi:hypothetical protein DPSP01_001838 [Paraphaeosphaeria sporulosa]|uniref:Extracellular membrane protein CFEM domain-containing protein n=1 Tax=Paraphaeosphaeria sporulosa TaxID=1460663 RepID=A0A177C576_9PLEO|nr:uncharacterized protein CC84DRAFT_1167970 [Paraphaeosphaeria sporulosa]OAG01830.1 hypothetical protein CC84DRAFT_1167970 [Paraphaeosphaeria sporulosa]
MRFFAFIATLAATAGLASAFCNCPDFEVECCAESGAPYIGNGNCDVTKRAEFDLYQKCCLGSGRFTACTEFPWLDEN